MNSNLNRIGFEIYLNNSKEKSKIHYFIEPHCSHGHNGILGCGPTRWPKVAAFGSPCQPGTPRVRPECVQRVVTTAGVTDMAWRSSARRSVNDDKILGTSILANPATCHYTHIPTVIV
jgi:hypothetical protein